MARAASNSTEYPYSGYEEPFLTAPTDSSGDAVTAQNYAAAVDHNFTPSSGKVMAQKLVLTLIDATVTGAAAFGALAALTNGITVRIKREGTVTSTILNVKTNADIMSKFDSVEVAQPAAGDHYLIAELDLNTVITSDDSVSVYVGIDDISGLSAISFRVRGYTMADDAPFV